MDAFEGLSVPTYFINRVVRVQRLGPCARLWFACVPDHAIPGPTMPELSTIWPVDTIAQAQNEILMRIATNATEVRTLMLRQ